MRQALHNIERIESYILGTMKGVELDDFQKEMETSKTLEELVQAQQLIIQAVSRKSLQADIAKFGSSSTGLGLKSWMVIIGVAFTALITISYFVLPQTIEENQSYLNKQPTNQEAVAEQTLGTKQTISGICYPSRVNQLDTIHSTTTVLNTVKPDTSDKVTISYDDDTHCGGLQTWILPKQQYYSIDPSVGATIEGKDGTLIIVPSNGFVDSSGVIITEEVQMELVEALEMADMIAYNLTTTSSDKHLQSGGMIYIQPKVEEKEVLINPARPLYIEIPTDEVNKDMLVWRGEVDTNGNIDWVTPQPLQKFLTPVDFELLDFLPNGFAEEVEAGMPFKSYTTSSKALVDSLYYTLGVVSSSNNISPSEIEKAEDNWGGAIIKDGYATAYLRVNIVDDNGKGIENVRLELRSYGNTWFEAYSDALGTAYVPKVLPGDYQIKISKAGYQTNYRNGMKIRRSKWNVELDKIPPLNGDPIALYESVQKETTAIDTNNCFIDPLTIKTIKTTAYSQSFLATTAFEERIKVLHQMPDAQELFDVYHTHLLLNLYEADSMVAVRLNGDNKAFFTDFANEKLTNVKGIAENIYQEQLSTYYNNKKKEYKKSLVEIQSAYRKKTNTELGQLKSKISELKNEYNTVGVKSTRNTWNGFKMPRNSVVTSNSYATKWYSSGWMNIDAYLHLLEKGEKEVELFANNPKGDPKIYQCINTLNTVIPLTINNDKTVAKFPKKGQQGAAKMKNTYCIGLNRVEDQLYIAEKHYNPYQQSSLTLNWEKTDKEQLYKHLKTLFGADNLLKNLKRQEKLIAEQMRINAKKIEIKEEMNALTAELKLVQNKTMVEAAFIERLSVLVNSCSTVIEDKIMAIESPVNSIRQPNAFTPNGDGINDYFYMPKLRSKITNTGYRFLIKDIISQSIVFETNIMREGWDGTNDDVQLPEGSYFWEVRGQKIISAAPVYESGIIQLLR